MVSYPVPGPAGRTTALPLRLRIPPLSLSSAWKSGETSCCERTMELWRAGSSSGDKALLQGGAAGRLRPVREGYVVSSLCSLPPHTSQARAHPGALAGCSLCRCSKETWQQWCCNSSTSSIISCALTVRLGAARKRDHFFQTPRRLNRAKSYPGEISVNVAKYCEIKGRYHKSIRGSYYLPSFYVESTLMSINV